MGHPLEHRRSLPDHMEPAGDAVAAHIVIETYPGRCVIVSGDIDDDLRWTREALNCAKKILVDHHAKKSFAKPLVRPACAERIDIVVTASGSEGVTGHIGDLELALIAIDNALEAVKSPTGRRDRRAVLLAADMKVLP